MKEVNGEDIIWTWIYKYITGELTFEEFQDVDKFSVFLDECVDEYKEG